ncbi:uncharacterized protein LOC105422810 isoform X2 [Pogonomyrmex barbatus]|nr:uncharacterized protein LOC105422810 isoform X2 [Pogonomyrmex barbatus]
MPHNKDLPKWIEETMMKIIEKLGPNVHKAQYELTEFNDNLIMSSLCYVRLQFENKTNEKNEELHVILKKPMKGFSQIAHIDDQFHNEILFYQKYVQPDEIDAKKYARCLYFDERPPNDSIIALENVNQRGYYSCPYMYDSPGMDSSMEYVLAAMRELGRFHGKGYVMKELQREKFFDIVAQCKEVRFAKYSENVYETLPNIQSIRAIEYLRKRGHDPTFCDKMETFLSEAFDKVMMKVVQPVEPLATLCHGDFILGNILFKTEDNGQYQPMLIDFALIRYSTPVVDLSTFLCLCCSNDMRRKYFFEIMRAYHDALRGYLLKAGFQNIEKYSYDALLDDFRRGALFGFVIASSFLFMILGHANMTVLVQDIINLGRLESAKKYKYAGGDELSKILADMLLHLKDLGCLKHVL